MYRSYVFDASWVAGLRLLCMKTRTPAAMMHATPASTPITMPAMAPPLRPDEDVASEESVFESEALVKVFPVPVMNLLTELIHIGRLPENVLSDTSSRSSWRNAPGLSSGVIGPDKELCCSSSTCSNGKYAKPCGKDPCMVILLWLGRDVCKTHDAVCRRTWRLLCPRWSDWSGNGELAASYTIDVHSIGSNSN